MLAALGIGLGLVLNFVLKRRPEWKVAAIAFGFGFVLCGVLMPIVERILGARAFW